MQRAGAVRAPRPTDRSPSRRGARGRTSVVVAQNDVARPYRERQPRRLAAYYGPALPAGTVVGTGDAGAGVGTTAILSRTRANVASKTPFWLRRPQTMARAPTVSSGPEKSAVEDTRTVPKSTVQIAPSSFVIVTSSRTRLVSSGAWMRV